MKQKTCIILTAISFGLRALALADALMAIVFQEPLKRLYSVSEELIAIHSVPWNHIVQALLWLIITGIVLLILMKKPSRDGIVILTILSALIYTADSSVLSFVLNDSIMRASAMKGSAEVASISALTNAMSRLLSILNTPAMILFFLGLGGACGKDFRTEA